MQLRALCIMLSAAVLCLSGCRQKDLARQQPVIATTTSYLEAAAADLLQNPRFLRLAEPGTCPGHFDVRPSEVQRLRTCWLVLRFDFQKSLDARLTLDGDNKPAVCEVALEGGMGRPETYFSACQQVARHFIKLGLLDETAAESRLRTINSRLSALSGELKNRVVQAGLAGTPVVASHHQEDFCKWLGLNVVAVFRGADSASIREIDRAIGAGRAANVRVVIANLPEGRRTADALAARLGARLVVFENFPMPKDGVVSFDAMVTRNIERLVAGVQQ